MTYKRDNAMEKVIRSNNDLGAAIRLARKSSNLRQVDVARKASVRQALVSDIENGATTAKLDTVIRILAALDLDLSVVPRRTTSFDPTEY
jgi:HTH-type transcriptional regulator/antitoxin HipB